MIKKFIVNLNLSKTSGPDCILVMILENYEPELSYILVELFNKHLKESCFPDCWKLSLMVSVFNNVGKALQQEDYCPVSLFSVVSKV